jgi:VWFA-related protein
MRTKLLWACALAVPASLAGQTSAPPPDQRAGPTFEAGTAAVVLDVVVRDKKGRSVRDLTAADFEVSEDGVRQEIHSFQVVSRTPEAASPGPSRAPATTSASTPAAPAATPEEASRPALVAIIFDRMSRNGRQLAHKAALSYLEQARQPDDLVGVFAIDMTLRTLQLYTTEASLLRQALDRASVLASSQVGSAAEQARSVEQGQEWLAGQQLAAESAAGAQVSGPAGGAAAQAAGVAAGAAGVQQQLNELTSNMLRTFEALERDQRGLATANGLMAVVNSLRSATGRKTVLFFSEGMAIPESVRERFRSVIDTANRGNVSIYTMDAAGLRVESTTEKARDELMAAAARRMRQVATGRDDGGILTKDIEHTEEALRMDPHSGLGQLADQTGGFLIRDTNDLAAGVRRIDEDMHFHYVLAYSPSNQDYDGVFRTIAVKVDRPGMEVQTRKGYYAIRSPLPTPVLAYEAPGLAALDRRPVPQDFRLRTKALSFPEPSRPGLVPVLVEVPGGVITYKPDETRKSYRADFTVLVRIRDASGRAVQKLSQHYPMTGPLPELDAARKGAVLFYRETDLPPGRYTVDAVAYDALAHTTAVHSAPFEVPAAEDGTLRLSSLMLVKRVERVPEAERRADDPLTFGDVLLYPNLDEPVSKAAQKELAFYLTAYMGKNAPPPTASLEILQNGRPLAQAPAPLPAPDSKGRIQHVGGLPLAAFSPGTYELRIVLSDTQSRQSSTVSFTVVD